MSRQKFDQAAADALAQAISEIEKNTNAEIVVVVRGRSGSYRHADYLFGAIIALVGLIFVLFSPWEFHTYWIPFDVTGLFVAGAFVSSRGDWLRRLFTSKTIQQKAARTGAAAMFYEAGIANTDVPLIFNCQLFPNDDNVENVASSKAVGEPPLMHALCVWTAVKHALACVSPAAASELHLPATGENPNELADGPRIELK